MTRISDESTAKRRKVRKGTHSCRECRRRKVRCIFATPQDVVCITCHCRGAKCISQTDSEGHDATETSTLKDAFIVGATSQEPSTTSVAMILPLDTLEHVEQLPTPTAAPTPAPAPAPAFGDDFNVEAKSHQAITQSLLGALPCRKDIQILLGPIEKLSLLSYQFNYSSQRQKTYEMLQEPISVTNLLSPEAHPVLLAKQMLLFAIALRYLSPHKTIPGLTKHHHVIMGELSQSAINLVNMNDALLGTLEGLENLILEGLYHIDGGNIRRAWITMRRAVMAAQLLGLYRPDQYRFKVIRAQGNLDPAVMWPRIVCMERVLSLLLGLPTSTIAPNLATRDTLSAPRQCDSLEQVVLYLSAKVLERNQIQTSPQALEMTQEIDRELIRMTADLPSTFWQPPSFSGLDIDSIDGFLQVRKTMDYMCYYTVVNQLHLPYILCPNNYSRMACVNASREVLSREIAIRTFNPVATCSRMGDFLALMAGMTLILVHLVSHCQETTSTLLVHQRLSDRAIVERALECMESMSELRYHVLAVLLRDLLAVEADATKGHIYRAQGVEYIDEEGDDNSIALIISVPYVGIVKIAREGTVSMTSSGNLRDQGVQEDVPIGGIGILHINRPKSIQANHTENTSDEPATQTTNTPSIKRHLAYTNLATSEDLCFQRDSLFPNAPAHLDDWMLQGFDSTFFDVLMNGAGAQRGNNTSEDTGSH
ncbi:hypothetical protein FOMG_13196 [Fusarium oxysporum f. sp. melonis 26406]|uniref:Zn(2)-C6 fungal-type domain-containing protein n=1 Tax=Fusarium oxysporum f. sp. melonis 26406 TaxID=1089452 RepID=W9ZQ00_FUSOX|nr:hypothetical protein FOMG_13196 [Fusarium oxysporum f. sp. melonis 26406]